MKMKKQEPEHKTNLPAAFNKSVVLLELVEELKMDLCESVFLEGLEPRLETIQEKTETFYKRKSLVAKIKDQTTQAETLIQDLKSNL